MRDKWSAYRMNEDYRLIRSKRKSVAVCVDEKSQVIVRAPIKMSVKCIEDFLDRHLTWIEKQKNLRETELQTVTYLTNEEIQSLKEKAKEFLLQRVTYYSSIMAVSPTGIKITSANGRWGSCSWKNSLCFPYKIMLLPEELIDYIVVHELAHIREKNHSKNFYAEVEKYMPNYKQCIKQLKLIQKSLPKVSP
ncbi:MAG: M48 family metallopeptidase [Oscillospiraceae bacterium]